MKKALLFLAFLFPIFLFSQRENTLIQEYLNSNQAKLGLTPSDIQGWIVESKATSKSTSISNYYIRQRSNEIEIYGAVSNVWIKNNQVIQIGNRFVKNATQKANAVNPQLTVLQALSLAKNKLEINDSFTNTILTTTNTKTFILSNVLNGRKIKAKLIYQPKNNQLLLAWHFEIHVPSQNQVWNVRINALDGNIIEKKDKVISCHISKEESETQNNFFFYKSGYKQNSALTEIMSGSYRVVPYNVESPNHGPRQLILSPADALASPFGWHDTDGMAGADETITAGNNAYAYEDTTDSGFGESPDGGANLTFDFPYNGINVEAINSLNAATTNLFYMNNIIHDVFYHYGFDEENGNFQFNNYSGLGDGFDNVFAESQDGGGINNANFYTPADGESGFMQMYLWNRKPVANLITVTSPPSFAGNYQGYESVSIPNTLRLPIAPSFVSGELIKIIDDTNDTSDGCGTIMNTSEINGKIVMIKRGSCSTYEKMFSAQNAGAIAVIIYTDLPGNFVVGGFVEEDITIPVISVKKDVADLLLNQMVSGSIHVRLSSPETDFVNVDGDFDNLIITHEYGHGISNRLTGGRFNTDCLDNNEQMGEGWSDWFGLMLQLKAGDNGEQRRGIGTFAINQPTNDVGIRSYPYSTDMTVNPFTFADTNTQIRPHGVGSVWATMLWDLSWAYINKYGFNPNIYTGNGGNNKVMQLVIDGLKLQPCLPSFVEGRDALIAADQAITGGQDFCMIWEVFARRGLGLSASSGDGDSTTDQIASFDVPAPGPVCTLGIDYNLNDDLISVYPNPSNGNFNISINAFSGRINYQLFDLNGRKILEESNVDFNNEVQVNLVGVQTGIYLIKIYADNLSTTKKIMVK